MSQSEYEDLRLSAQFRSGPGTMEGKWFADSYEGVRCHAEAHYPDGDCYIVAADIPEALLSRLFRSANLDGFGPATYLDPSDLKGITPVFEVDHG